MNLKLLKNRLKTTRISSSARRLNIRNSAIFSSTKLEEIKISRGQRFKNKLARIKGKCVNLKIVIKNTYKDFIHRSPEEIIAEPDGRIKKIIYRTNWKIKKVKSWITKEQIVQLQTMIVYLALDLLLRNEKLSHFRVVMAIRQLILLVRLIRYLVRVYRVILEIQMVLEWYIIENPFRFPIYIFRHMSDWLHLLTRKILPIRGGVFFGFNITTLVAFLLLDGAERYVIRFESILLIQLNFYELELEKDLFR